MAAPYPPRCGSPPPPLLRRPSRVWTRAAHPAVLIPWMRKAADASSLLASMVPLFEVAGPDKAHTLPCTYVRACHTGRRLGVAQRAAFPHACSGLCVRPCRHLTYPGLLGLLEALVLPDTDAPDPASDAALTSMVKHPTAVPALLSEPLNLVAGSSVGSHSITTQVCPQACTRMTGSPVPDHVVRNGVCSRRVRGRRRVRMWTMSWV